MKVLAKGVEMIQVKGNGRDWQWGGDKKREGKDLVKWQEKGDSKKI